MTYPRITSHMGFSLLVAVFRPHPIQSTGHRTANGKENLYGDVAQKTVDSLSGKVGKFRAGIRNAAMASVDQIMSQIQAGVCNFNILQWPRCRVSTDSDLLNFSSHFFLMFSEFVVVCRKRQIRKIPHLLVFLPDDVEEAEDLLWLAGPVTGQLGQCTFAGSFASRFIVGVSSPEIGGSTWTRVLSMHQRPRAP